MSKVIGWLSLENSKNRGNYIIEYATYTLLGKNRQIFKISSFENPRKEELKILKQCSFVVLPGSTQLNVAEHPIADLLLDLNIPVIAIGVALCCHDNNADLTIARNIKCKIGSRDPFTHQQLIKSKIPSQLVGCSTLFLGNATNWKRKKGPIVISLGRGPQRPLQECVRICSSLGPVILLNHVPDLQPDFKVPSNVKKILLTDPYEALQIYNSASVVLTGRIHGYLPSIALGTPAFFFGDWYDSRYSLLQYLDTEILYPDPEQIFKRLKKVIAGELPEDKCFQKVNDLRNSMTSFLRKLDLYEQRW